MITYSISFNFNDVAPRVTKVLFQNGMNNLQKCFQS